MMNTTDRISNLSLASVFLLCVPFLMLAVSAAHTETLSGTVLDMDDGVPVSNASVTLTELNSAVMTDESGGFSFEDVPDGAWHIRASRVGYAPAVMLVTVPRMESITITLTRRPHVSGEIVSTSRGRYTRLDEIPGSTAVVTEETVRETNPVSIPDALSRVAGIAAGSDMPWSGRPVIRGLSRDQVVMLVDGARVSTATTLPAQFGTVALGDIERVEILKGPISVLYGSGSTGGVVNVITRRGHFTPGNDFTVSLQPSYESAARGIGFHALARASGPGAYLTLSRSDRDYGDYLAGGDERMRNSRFEDSQSRASLGLRVGGRHTIELQHQRFTARDVGIPGGAAFPVTASAVYPLTRRSLTDAVWRWRPAPAWWEESTLSVYHQPVERYVEIRPNASTLIEPDGDHHVTGGRWQHVLKIGAHDIVGGIEGWRKTLRSRRSVFMNGSLVRREIPVPDSHQRPVGLFVEDVFPLGGRLRVTLGGRLDMIHTENESAPLTIKPQSDDIVWRRETDDDMSWSIVAGGVYEATSSLNLNLTAARSFRSPTIEERYLYAQLGQVLTIGDPGLDPENGLFIEGGGTLKMGGAGIGIQAYLNDVRDMVVRAPGGDWYGTPADYHYVNAGRARLHGFELTADWAPSERFLASADYSLVRGRDTEGGADLPSIPPDTAHASVRIIMPGGWWTEPRLTLVNAQNRTAPGERSTPGYGLLDLSAGYSLTTGNGDFSWDVVLGIRNAADRTYRDHLTVSRGYDVLGMGRSVYATCRVSAR